MYANSSTPQLLQRTFHQRVNALIDGRSKPPGVWSELTTRRYTVDMPEICYKVKGALFSQASSLDRVADELKSRGFSVKARLAIPNGHSASNQGLTR
jgi:hypothetical protein